MGSEFSQNLALWFDILGFGQGGEEICEHGLMIHPAMPPNDGEGPQGSESRCRQCDSQCLHERNMWRHGGMGDVDGIHLHSQTPIALQRGRRGAWYELCSSSQSGVIGPSWGHPGPGMSCLERQLLEVAFEWNGLVAIQHSNLESCCLQSPAGCFRWWHTPQWHGALDLRRDTECLQCNALSDPVRYQTK